MWIYALLSLANATTTEVQPGDDLFAILDGLQAGDEVLVHGGTYSTQSSGGSWYRNYDWQGTSSDPIWVHGVPGETVVIEGDPAGSQNVLNMSGSYFTFENFEMMYGSHGLRVGTSAHVSLLDLHIHDTGDVGLSMNIPGNTYEDMTVRGTHIHDTNGTGECMYLGCNDDGCQVFDSLIEYNWCHDTYNTSQGDGIELKSGSYNTIIWHNVIHDVQYPGVTVYGALGRGPNEVSGNVIWNAGDNGVQIVGEVSVTNNIVLNSGNNGIQSKSSQGATPHALFITHNTVVGAGDACLRGNDWTGSTDGVVANNVFLCTGANGIRLPSGAGAVSFLANAVDGNDEGPGGSFMADLAHFLDVPGMDYYPAAGAALLDAGDAGEAALKDFNCLDRDASPDVGAYEGSDVANPGWIPTPGFKMCAAGAGTGPTGTGPTGNTGTDTTPSPTAGTDTGGVDVADEAGCGCSTQNVEGPSLWMIALLWGLARRRVNRS